MAPELSLVIPLHNEQSSLDELLRRTIATASQITEDFELVLVDDASTDGTGQFLDQARTRDFRVRPVHLTTNQGQFLATLEGLRKARGKWIVVLDGDLQDPPETVVDLVREMRRMEGCARVVYAVKRDRQAGSHFKLFRATYEVLLRLGDVVLPPGAGSYVLMDASIASAIARCRLRYCNLAVAVATKAGTDFSTVEYVKQARISGRSRVGWSGLFKEAGGSLLLSGALHRLLGLGGLAAFTGGALSPSFFPWARWPLLVLGMTFVGLSLLAWKLRKGSWGPEDPRQG